MKNALSFDVEDWYQVVSERMVGKETQPSPIVKINASHILSILAEYQVKATFFVVGKVAEAYPELIKEIHQQGHEIASHGYVHQTLFHHTPESFRSDLRLSLSVLEAITGEKPLGFRAPAFSITQDTLWALDILKEEGIQYDSSIFPIKHRRYGIQTAPRFPYQIEIAFGDGIMEFPLSICCLAGFRLPFCGGGYMRLLPYSFVKKAIQQLNSVGNPAILYFHPYEFSKEESKLHTGHFFTDLKFRLYKASQNWGRAKSEAKLRKLLAHFDFSSIREVLDEYRQHQHPTLFSFKSGTV